MPFRFPSKYEWLDLNATALESVYNNAPLVTICYYNVVLKEAIPHYSNHYLQDIMAAVATLLPPQLHLQCSISLYRLWFESKNKRRKIIIIWVEIAICNPT